MSIARFVPLFGGLAIALAGCAQPPAPDVTRATPLFAKSGAALCIPSDPLPGTNYPPGAVNCDEICVEDPQGAIDVAICPPVYTDPQRPGGGDDDPQTPPRTATPATPTVVTTSVAVTPGTAPRP